ncbi:MAG TPA: glycosyltransferase [Acidimicrobiales bacterium]|nr:glycosyltransferase [Acidimicrobiales bacterium]
MTRLSGAWRRVAARARRGPGGADEATIERLDRINHWVVHLDRGQQALADAVAGAAERLDGAVAGLAAVEARLSALNDTVAHLNHFQHHDLRDDLRAIGRTLAVASEQLATIDPPIVAGGPLVSVVCPVHNRAHLVDRALAGVVAQTYERWELLLVDDGSDDIGDDDVARWGADPRVTVVRATHRGVGAARNRGLAEATGDIVAYLDVDNAWHPTYLARVVDALERRPAAGWTVASQIVVGADRFPAVRDDRHDFALLARHNFVDLNALAHRRSLLDETGGFDDDRARLGDWDLVQRLAAVAGEPARIAAVGSIYDDAPRADRIGSREPLHPHLAALRERGRGRPAEGLRVLLAEWHYPQASESYLRADLIGLQALGAQVEVWSEEDVAVWYPPDAPLHRGTLAAALEAVRPDVVLTHWLHVGAGYREAVRAADVPLAVRGHGFDHDPAVLAALLDDPGVMVHLFPHLAEAARPHPRLVPLPVAFDQDRYPPAQGKDRRLVVRTGVGLRTKDYETFLAAAARCPEHRFVLALCRGYLVEDQADEVIARRDALDAPVEIVVDLSPAKAAELVAGAGVYLHTHGRDHTYGMSVSIAEALGTGCYVVAPDLPGMRGYVGEAADLYVDAAQAAALVQQTAHWDDARWTDRRRRAADHAHVNFGAADVAGDMVAQWREVLGVRPR